MHPEIRYDKGDLPPGQFRILASSGNLAMDGDDISSLVIGHYTIVHHRLLSVRPIYGSGDRLLGAILGTMLDAQTGDVLDPCLIAQAVEAADANAGIESIYLRAIGSWSLLIEVNGTLRWYLDAAGTMSGVFSQELCLAGSTAAAILTQESYAERFDFNLYARLDVAREGWFPAGLTAHRGVRRLMCNHYLDFGSWKPVRHWPLAAPTRQRNGAALIKEIAESVRDNMRTMMGVHRCALALTGGYDSRMLLSLLRSETGTSHDTYIINSRGGPDPYLAARLAALCGTKHRELSARISSREEELSWHYRVGHTIGGSNAKVYTTLLQLEGVDGVIEGMAGEVARSFFWRVSDSPATQLDGRAITMRFGMPPEAEVIDAVNDWLRGVPRGDALYILDLVYLELRVSCWHYAQSYADRTKLHFSPMVGRKVFEAMFKLPVALKRNDAMPKAVIASTSPELMGLPFSRYGDARDMIALVRKAVRPHLVLKKLRKMWGR